jgi:hypothetical protein
MAFFVAKNPREVEFLKWLETDSKCPLEVLQGFRMLSKCA